MSKTTGAFLVVLLVSIPALAEFAEFRADPNREVTTVAKARAMRDGTRVILEGYVVKALQDDHYLFRDDTGEIDVEITERVWRDRPQDPETKVWIRGEVDRYQKRVRILVRKLKILAEDKESEK